MHAHHCHSGRTEFTSASFAYSPFSRMKKGNFIRTHTHKHTCEQISHFAGVCKSPSPIPYSLFHSILDASTAGTFGAFIGWKYYIFDGKIYYHWCRRDRLPLPELESALFARAIHNHIRDSRHTQKKWQTFRCSFLFLFLFSARD